MSTVKTDGCLYITDMCKENVNDYSEGEDGPFRVEVSGKPRVALWSNRVADAVLVSTYVGGLVSLMLVPLTEATTGARVALGIWTGLLGLLSWPGLALLFAVPARPRLRERSALLDRAVPFLHTVWRSAAAIASMVVGTVVGVNAAAIATEEGPDAAVSALLAGSMQVAVLKFIGVVAAVAGMVMVLRLLLDLRSAANEKDGQKFFDGLERRWFGRVIVGSRASVARPLFIQGTVLGASIGLPLLLVTFIATVVVATTA